MNTAERIVAIITKKKQVRAHDLTSALGISSVAVHKQLKKLVQTGLIEKRGKPPVVYYVLSKTFLPIKLNLRATETSQDYPDRLTVISPEAQKILDETYLYISPSGELVEGTAGFIRWATGIKESDRVEKLAEEYLRTRKSANNLFTRQGWVNATESKVRTTFKESALDRLLYADFYSLPKFGKTMLGNMMLYAKQSQNRELSDRVIERVRPTINRIIEHYQIDCVAYIPPSVNRPFQFMKEFADKLRLPLKRIPLSKSYLDIVVPQKTLSRLEERLQNAEETIFVDTANAPSTSKNVLLIDDAVGSAATLHVVSNKIKEQNLVTGKIIGFAITGSMKGFEVIREV